MSRRLARWRSARSSLLRTGRALDFCDPCAAVLIRWGQPYGQRKTATVLFATHASVNRHGCANRFRPPPQPPISQEHDRPAASLHRRMQSTHEGSDSPPLRTTSGPKKSWPCASNSVCLSPFISRVVGARRCLLGFSRCPGTQSQSSHATPIQATPPKSASIEVGARRCAIERKIDEHVPETCLPGRAA